MTRRMADACTPMNIPDGIDLVGYYVDGDCAAPPIKGTQHVPISSIATNAGTVGDCEPRNPRPAAWVIWVQQRRAAGVDPTIYCADDSLGSFFDGFHWRDVRAAFQAAGVPEPHYWICKPGATSIPAGAVAVQDQMGVENDRYDLSIVAAYWPGVDPAPAPTPIPQEDDDMGDIGYLYVAATKQEHSFEATGKGTLIHEWNGGFGWTPETLGAGLVPRTPVTARLDADENQIQVWARMADGREGHWWQNVGAATWGNEIVGDADGGQPVPDAIAALEAGQAAVKAELDTVAGAVASGQAPNLTALSQAVSAVDGHVATLGKHLGVDVTTGADT